MSDAAYHQAYYNIPENKQKIKARSKAWYKNHKSEARKVRKVWLSKPENKEAMRIWRAKYRRDNPDKFKEYNITANANRKKKKEAEKKGDTHANE